MSEMAERHEQYIRKEAMRLGLIDMGPVADHSAPVRDTRDLRDPAEVGSRLLAAQKTYPGMATGDVYDQCIPQQDIPDYAHGESLVQSTVAKYRQKMTEQAAKGDLAAVRVLIDKEWPLPE